MQLYSVLTAGALVVILLFILGRKVIRFVYLACKLPGPSLWQLANVHAKHLIGEDMVTHVWKMCAAYNFKPWGMWVTNGTGSFVIVVSDCETISEVYRNKNTAEKSTILYKQLENLMGRSLVTMIGGREYTQHRKIFSVGLRKCSQDWFLPKLFETMSTFVREIRKKAADGREVDTRSLVDPHITASAIASFTSEPPEDLAALVQTFVNIVYPRMDLLRIEATNPIYYWFVRLKPSSKQLMTITKTFMLALDKILMNEYSRAPVEEDPRCVLQTMVQSYRKMIQGNGEEICQIGRLLVVASIETTAFMMNMLFIVLALHQDVQQRVFDELSSVLGDEERPIVMEDLDRMEYMEMVIKETMRLFPPAAMTGRRVLEDTNLNGVLAPKGSTVIINPFALHRNPEYFPDPLKFDPDRFSPEASRDLRPFSYIPFSAGTRSCPGQLYAFILMKLSLCYAVRNFKILPGDKLKSFDDIKFKICFSLHLEEVFLRFVDRFPVKV